MTLAREALELVGRDPQAAIATADAAIAEATRARVPAARAVGLRARCLAERELGRIPEAFRDGQAAVRAARACGDTVTEAEARMSLAFVLLERGSVAAALHQADRSAAGLRGLPAARLATQRALILQRTGHYAEAMAAYRRALPALTKHGDLAWQARLRNNRGLLQAYHGSLREAERDLLAALELHETSGAELSAADTRWNLGFVAARGGDAPSALEHFDTAALTFHRHHVPAPELLLDRVELLLAVGASAEARDTAEKAVARLRGHQLDLHLPEAMLLLAQATIAAGAPSDAVSVARDAAQLFAVQGRRAWAVLARYVAVRAAERAGERSPALLSECRALVTELTESRWSVHALDVRLTAGRIARALGDRDTAHRELTAASAGRSSAVPAVSLRGWYAEALLRLELGNTSGAERALRAGMDQLDRQRAALGASELRMHVAGHATDVAGLGTRLAIDAGSARRVLAWAERWRAGSLRLRPVLPPRDEVLADLLADLRRATAEAEEARLAGRPAGHEEATLATAEAKVRSHTRRQRGSDIYRTTDPVTADGLVAALDEHALVEFVEHDDRMVAVTVAAGRVHLHDLGPTEPIRRQVHFLVTALRRATTAPDGVLADRAGLALGHAAAELDRLILGPLRHELRDRELVVVPTGGLHDVPWSALPRLSGRSVTVAPSASLWHRAATSAVDARGHDVLAVAGPRLAAAEHEVSDVVRLRGGAALTGPAASVEAVLAGLSGADTVHIAAHGRLRVDNPLLSSLEMVDGPLTVYDLERLPHVPRLVLLPACQSGSSRVHTGDEVLGLAHALLAFGARAIVATVVAVPDTQTREFMACVHAGLASGRTPSDALAVAQSASAGVGLRAAATASAFVCFGAGSSG